MAGMQQGGPPATTAVHVMISGRVQGVGYRAWCARRAAGHGLSGCVRNRAGGEVEAVFSGPRAAVEAMLEECGEGPDWARVVAVDVLGAAGAVDGPFQVLPTE